MKRTLTITFEFDEEPWKDDMGTEHPTDPVAYAMNMVNSAVPCAYPEDFVDARLDGEILVDSRGFVSEEVKKRECQHQVFLNEVACRFF